MSASQTFPPDKPTLRVQALARRDALGQDVRRQGAAGLSQAGQGALQVAGRCVSAYHAIGSEIDPAPLMLALEAAGAMPALPVLLDRQTMVFRRWDRSNDLVPVGFGTLGPDSDQGEVLPDLVLAPLAAFTAIGQRIGYGKGHYDRALSKMHAAGHVPGLIGLAYDEQDVPAFRVEEHDIALDAVLTPTGLRLFDHGHEALAPFLS